MMDSKEEELNKDYQKIQIEEGPKSPSKLEMMQMEELMEDMEEDLPK